MSIITFILHYSHIVNYWSFGTNEFISKSKLSKQKKLNQQNTCPSTIIAVIPKQSIPNAFFDPSLPHLRHILEPSILFVHIVFFANDNPLHIISIALFSPVVDSQMHVFVVQSAHALLYLFCLISEVVYHYFCDVLFEIFFGFNKKLPDPNPRFMSLSSVICSSILRFIYFSFETYL